MLFPLKQKLYRRRNTRRGACTGIRSINKKIRTRGWIRVAKGRVEEWWQIIYVDVGDMAHAWLRKPAARGLIQ